MAKLETISVPVEVTFTLNTDDLVRQLSELSKTVAGMSSTISVPLSGDEQLPLWTEEL